MSFTTQSKTEHVHLWNSEHEAAGTRLFLAGILLQAEEGLAQPWFLSSGALGVGAEEANHGHGCAWAPAT